MVTSTDFDSDIATLAAAMRTLQRLRSSKRVHAALMDAAGADLSQQAMQVLLALDDGASVAEISRAAEMDMGAVSRQLKSLDDSGLVTRTASPENGSVVQVHRTAAGRRLSRQLSDVRDRHLMAALGHWNGDDIEQLSALLQRLVDDLQATPYPATTATGTRPTSRRTR